MQSPQSAKDGKKVITIIPEGIHAKEAKEKMAELQQVEEDLKKACRSMTQLKRRVNDNGYTLVFASMLFRINSYLPIVQ